MDKKDIAGVVAIDNAFIWGLPDVRPADKTILFGLIKTADLYGTVPEQPIATQTTYRQISRAMEIYTSRFCETVKRLSEHGILSRVPTEECQYHSDYSYFNERFKNSLAIMPLDNNCLSLADNFKSRLTCSKSKSKKLQPQRGYTYVSQAILFGYPEVSLAAKFVYVFIKSLDWTGKKITFHRQRKLATLANIPFQTWSKYVQELQDAKLIEDYHYQNDNRGNAIFINAPTEHWQQYAIRIKPIFKMTANQIQKRFGFLKLKIKNYREDIELCIKSFSPLPV